MVGINAGHVCSVGIEQPALEVFDAWLKRDRPRIDIQVDFIGKSARDTRSRNSRCVSRSPSNLSGSRGRLGLSPTARGSLLIPRGPEPGTMDCNLPISPSWKVSGALPKLSGNPPVNGTLRAVVLFHRLVSRAANGDKS